MWSSVPMMKLTFRHMVFAMLASSALIGSASVAQANPGSDRAWPRADTRPNARIVKTPQMRPAMRSDMQPQYAAVKVSASRAKAIALSHVRGSEFLDIRLIEGHTYRVRVIKKGRRIDVYVDANTGRVK